MQLLQPIYLLFSLGIVLPLAIHLWNRKRGNIVEMGSLRFLTELPKEQISSIELTQKRLLLLRSLIILLLALLLAGLAFFSSNNKKSTTWVLVEPTLLNEPLFKQQLTTYQTDSSEFFLGTLPLKPLPNEQDFQSNDLVSSDYFAISEFINSIPNPADSLVIFTKGEVRGFRSIPQINIPTKWIAVPSSQVKENRIIATREYQQDSLLFLVSTTHDEYTAHSWFKEPKSKSGVVAGINWELDRDSLRLQNGDALPVMTDNIVVSIYAIDTTRKAVRQLKAGINTLNLYAGFSIQFKLYKQLEKVIQAEKHILIDADTIPSIFMSEEVLIVRIGNESFATNTLLSHQKNIPIIYLDTEKDRSDINLIMALADNLTESIKVDDFRKMDANQLKAFVDMNGEKRLTKTDNLETQTTHQVTNYVILGICLLLICLERFVTSRR